MFSKFTLARKYLHYYITAANGKGHGIHSPFIFEFVQQVLNDHRKYYAYQQVEARRRLMRKDHSMIEVEDRGAGSAVTNNPSRSIAQIARASLKPTKYAQLLFRMVNYYQPARIIELGTSLGITTAYLALANTAARVVTIEGASSVARKANENFKSLEIPNVRLVQGTFEEMLEPALQELGAVDFAFIDGNHRKQPTLAYFELILQRSQPRTIIVFDDIHWSSDMEAAWEIVKAHPAISCTVDLFFLGLVFMKDEFRDRQHFKIRF